MTEPEGMHRWIPPTWMNREAREDGRLEPVVVSDDGTHVTWVGSPLDGHTAGGAP